MSFYQTPNNFAQSIITPTVVGGNVAYAAANYTAIKAALDTGKEVYIPENLGDIFIDRTLEQYSFQTLRMGVGSWLTKKSGATMFHLLRNVSAQNGVFVNATVIAGGLMPMNEPGHPWKVGDTVYCEGFLGNLTLNGPKVVVSAVPGVSWTFAAAGGNPTNTATQLVFTSRYNALDGVNFTRAANVVTVLNDPAERTVGDKVYIAGLGGANSFNGVAEVTASNPGVSWTYANVGVNEVATGTAQLLGDREIVFEGALNGNSPNMVYNQWGAHLSHWGNVSALQEKFTDSRYGIGGRVANHYNVSDVWVPYAKSSIQCSVLLQFDSYCDRVSCGTLFGDDLGDDVLAWGVTSNAGPFGATTEPTGPGNMGTLTADVIYGVSPTGIFKAYATAGFDLGRIKIGRIYGRGPVSIGDGNVGVTGGTITSLRIDDVDVIPTSSASNQIALGSGAFASMGEVSFGSITDNGLTAADTGYIMNISSPQTSVVIEKLVSRRQRTSIGILIGVAVPSLKVNNCDTTSGTGGTFFLAAGAGAIVADAEFNNVKHVGPVANGGVFLYEQAGGNWANVYINNFTGTTFKAIHSSNQAGNTHNIFATNVRTTGTGQLFGSDVQGTFNLNLTNVEVPTVSNNMLQYPVAATVVNCFGRDCRAPSGQFALFTSTAQIRIDCKEARVDMGANAAAPPAQLTPSAGDQITNTNAVGPGVYGRTVAGAWQLMY